MQFLSLGAAYRRNNPATLFLQVLKKTFPFQLSSLKFLREILSQQAILIKTEMNAFSL